MEMATKLCFISPISPFSSRDQHDSADQHIRFPQSSRHEGRYFTR